MKQKRSAVVKSTSKRKQYFILDGTDLMQEGDEAVYFGFRSTKPEWSPVIEVLYGTRVDKAQLDHELVRREVKE